jgi:hypothetical protein
MDEILKDIKKLIEEGDEDQVLEFAEILMWQNKKLISDNKQLAMKCQQFIHDKQFEPEPEQELRGLEKIEFREGISEEEFFAARSSD